MQRGARRWIIGTLFSTLTFASIWIVVDIFYSTESFVRSDQSRLNLKLLSNAWLSYAADNNDFSCPLDGWNRNLTPYAGAASLNDPLLAEQTEKRGYAINPEICQIKVGDLTSPEKYVLMGLTKSPGKDAILSPENLRPVTAAPFRTLYCSTIGIPRKALIDEAQRLMWKPAKP